MPSRSSPLRPPRGCPPALPPPTGCRLEALRINAGATDPALARAESHRGFLNAYYGLTRHVYDATRKPVLLGRDLALRQLSCDRWRTLVEVGAGTGRNLRWLRRVRPDAQLGGLDASDAMLAHARARCPWAPLVHGFAETADLRAIHGCRPDRVLLSYCLSMALDPRAALLRARASIAPQGEVVVVDFADMASMPLPLRAALRAWLGVHRVLPLPAALLGDGARCVQFGPLRYYGVARYGPLSQDDAARVVRVPG